MQRWTNQREISKPLALVDYSNRVRRGGGLSGWGGKLAVVSGWGDLVIARGIYHLFQEQIIFDVLLLPDSLERR